MKLENEEMMIAKHNVLHLAKNWPSFGNISSSERMHQRDVLTRRKVDYCKVASSIRLNKTSYQHGLN